MADESSSSSDSASPDFKAKDRVVAVHDLDGVPAGTAGRVVMVTGLSWIRYRVAFDNGVELGLLDGSHLAAGSKVGAKKA
ncbi:MAG: hypothetical protein ACR2HV_07550 [Acidimicrobiales bacterium]